MRRVFSYALFVGAIITFLGIMIGGVTIASRLFTEYQWLESAFVGASLLITLVVSIVASAQKTDWLSDLSRANLRRLLFLSTTMFGVLVSLVALVVGVATDVNLAEFWHSALLNLGTEILGAAFIFILLEGVWEELSKRDGSESNDEILSELKLLRQQISELKASNLSANHVGIQEEGNISKPLGGE